MEKGRLSLLFIPPLDRSTRKGHKQAVTDSQNNRCFITSETGLLNYCCSPTHPPQAPPIPPLSAPQLLCPSLR
jgi:hypothetical protein